MIGMLWYDPDPKKDLKAKITEAASNYQAKYGAVPDTCLLPLNTETAGLDGLGVKIVCKREIMPNHLLIGTEKVTAFEAAITPRL